MYRTSISIKDVDFKKIKAHAEKKSLITADYIRTLINIGLKVEEATQTRLEPQEPSALKDNEDSAAWKNLLTWELESRYLIRYLIKNGFQETIEQRNAFLREAKEKANAKVEQLLEPTLPGSDQSS